MKTLYIYLLVFIAMVLHVSAQWDNNIECPGDSSHCEWIDTVKSKDVQLSYLHDQYAKVTYRYRICNGVLEIDILSITTSSTNNAGDLRTFTVEHYEFASLRSALELGVMTDHFREIGIDSLPRNVESNVDSTNCADTVSYVSFFTASCGIFVQCRYTRTTDRNCDRGYMPPYPEYDTNSVQRVVYTKWQPCGYMCCKRTYTICRSLSDFPEAEQSQRIPILKILHRTTSTFGDCSLQTKYGSKPCYTNCWNTP